MVAFFLFPFASADQRQLYQPGFLAPNTVMAASPQMYAPAYATPEMYAPAYATPEMYASPAYEYAPVYEESEDWSTVAMLAVVGAAIGAAVGHQMKPKVSMLGVQGREVPLIDKIRNFVLAAAVSVGLVAGPVGAAQAVDVKLGSDGGQLVFVPDEVTIKAGESVTWIGNKGMPHNVVFDEEGVPDGFDTAAVNHEDMVNDEGVKVSSKFDKPGTYAYYCEPHRGAGMNGTVVVK